MQAAATVPDFKGSIFINCIKAELTHDTEAIGQMDPYIKAQFGTQIVKSKVLDEAGKKPDWKNEVLTLKDVQCKKGDLIQIWVMDEDVTSDDEVGKVELVVDTYFNGAKRAEVLKLTYKGKPAGELQ